MFRRRGKTSQKNQTKAAAEKLAKTGTPARVHGDESEHVAKHSGVGGPETAQDTVSKTPPPPGSRRRPDTAPRGR